MTMRVKIKLCSLSMFSITIICLVVIVPKNIHRNVKDRHSFLKNLILFKF